MRCRKDLDAGLGLDPGADGLVGEVGVHTGKAGLIAATPGRDTDLDVVGVDEGATTVTLHTMTLKMISSTYN